MKSILGVAIMTAMHRTTISSVTSHQEPVEITASVKEEKKVVQSIRPEMIIEYKSYGRVPEPCDEFYERHLTKKKTQNYKPYQNKFTKGRK